MVVALESANGTDAARRAADAERARKRRQLQREAPVTLTDALTELERAKDLVEQRISMLESALQHARHVEEELLDARRQLDAAKINLLRATAIQ